MKFPAIYSHALSVSRKLGDQFAAIKTGRLSKSLFVLQTPDLASVDFIKLSGSVTFLS
ncbi:hypothetical protein ACE1CD_30930 [Aerosakkonema sp. BLCC-F183]|uniref:hypothetical protein n=1 Tax=Aerosakkonema sp. BLCC-F183 TaxID=3342834 RepID=UPI0035B86AAB